jgi:hypothetical protein
MLKNLFTQKFESRACRSCHLRGQNSLGKEDIVISGNFDIVFALKEFFSHNILTGKDQYKSRKKNQQ